MHEATTMREELMRLLQLKDVKRQGWINVGVDDPESVASHSWGMAVLALRLCPSELDLVKVLQLCLLHDLPEIIVGDLTPQDDRSTKATDEHAAMKSLAPQWLNVFEEYEAKQSPESLFVHQMDKLDMALQAGIYEDSSGLDLSEFIASARKTLGDHPLLGD